MGHLHTMTAYRIFSLTLAGVAILIASSAAAELRVTPGRATLSPGEEIRFEARIRGRGDETIAGPIEWQVIPARLGTITPLGQFVAGQSSGRGIVRALVDSDEGGQVGHALVRVGTAGDRPLSIRVTPGRARLGIGESVSFRIERIGMDGAATVTWSVVPSGLGTIGADGGFQAGQNPGYGRIAAIVIDGENGRGMGYASVQVGSPEASGAVRLQLRPERAEAAPGGTIEFQLESTGLPDDAAIEWMAVPREIGTVVNGHFQAGSFPMEGRVVASILTPAGASRAVARVRIHGPRPDIAWVVRPEDVTVRSGDFVQFSMEPPGNQETDYSPSLIEWSVQPPEAGTISPDGLFQASSSEQGVPIVAHVIGLYRDPSTSLTGRGVARIYIPGDLADSPLIVRPRTATIPPGEQIRFSVEFDRVMDLPVEWSVQPRTIGTITPDGLFLANDVLTDATGPEFLRQEGVVFAKVEMDDRTFTGSAHLIVGGEIIPAMLVIEPKEIHAEVNLLDLSSIRPVYLSARAISPNHVSAPLVEWRVVPENLFEVHPRIGNRTELRLIRTAPSDLSTILIRGQVIAELLLENGQRIGATASIDIRIVGTIIQIQARPALLDLRVGESATIRVVVTGALDHVIDPSRVNFEATFNHPEVGDFDPDTRTFHAIQAGIGQIEIRARLKEYPAVTAVTRVRVTVRP